jgi:hypothetical protein
MSPTDEIYKEYINMRQHGLDSKEALRALRSYIDPLPQQTKQKLAAKLKGWEAKQRAKQTPDIAADKGGGQSRVIKRIQPLTKTDPPQDPSYLTDADAPPAQKHHDTEIWVQCINCGKKNRLKDVFCFSCGHMLEEVADGMDTKHFNEATNELYSDEYFGPDSVVMLSSRSSDVSRFELRPQTSNREVVIGRTAENQTVRPDLDLSPANASNLGVSRLHLSLTYDGANNTVQIKDLGSANGSYVNGQKILPTERRALRNGDEVRLGRLVLRVTFHHPGTPLY